MTPPARPISPPSRGDYLTPAELAELVQVSTATLRNWRYLGKLGPPFHKPGGTIRYLRTDVDAWLAASRSS